MPRYLTLRRRRRLYALAALMLLSGIGGAVLLGSRPAPLATAVSGPPWLYGPHGARFTLVVYADFECPYCQSTIPHLMQWVKTTPDVTLQWHHLPLPAHEPAASREARLAECHGEVGGATAFWNTVGWIYEHTRGNGQGTAATDNPSGVTAAVQTCLDSERSAAIVRAQADEAAAAGITATPTLQLRDRDTGRTLTLEGAVDDDALLSALDWLSLAPEVTNAERGVPALPADDVGKPR
ncbi:DsbA family protein [Burkholderia sp. F1]|uniref:DsbA family protein n=1 Tax=Burkholderia sp. F1 TaxID=3366817 RepID=UPI003D7081EB